METLLSRLQYKPRILQYGTSGRRGLVADLTQLEIYINASAELAYLQSLAPAEGGIRKGDDFFYAYDLRPSSSRFVPEDGGCGEIVQAVEMAVRDAGMVPVNCGTIPTPALALYALNRQKGSMMITGSHIPFDRNGYKTNTSLGELRKEDEEPINRLVQEIRERHYRQTFPESRFDEKGLFKTGHQELAPETAEARRFYIHRYTHFFAGRPLDGKRLLVYQHSAVGRDMLVEILQQLGAEVSAAGRSDIFVPVDTENVGDDQLAAIQSLVDAQDGSFDAVVSTDGDSDRPVVLGIDPHSGGVRFFGGDLLGMVVAEFLQADAVVVPINCNDAIDLGNLKLIMEPKTRLGSPFVIAGMQKASAKGKKRICGWEANGGFLLGSDIRHAGSTLPALPTRDAVLPILAVLLAAAEKGLSLIDLFARLPKRFSRAALLRNIPRAVGRKIMEQFSPADESTPPQIQEHLAEFFPPSQGFSRIAGLNYTDGLRIFFGNDEVVHLRPSGNADEFRIYAVADTQERANTIAHLGIAEPDGILRRLVRSVS